jgi:aldehyde oxidoreductase
MIKKQLNINGARLKIFTEPSICLAALFQHHLLDIRLNDGQCGVGDCRDCLVIVNGETVLSCAVPLEELPQDAIITTKEGMQDNTPLPALQLAWVLHGSPGCIKCSGKAISLAATMLEINPFPTRGDIEGWFSNQFARCCNSDGTRQARIDAVEDAARVVRSEISIAKLACMISTEKKVIDLEQLLNHGTIDGSSYWIPVPELGIWLPPDTLHLALVRAGVSNAELVTIDTQKAWDVPGVYRVITAYDVRGSNYLSCPAFSSPEKRLGFNRPILCISNEEVKSKHEVIAVVCADSPQNALAAARQVKATYNFSGKEAASGATAETESSRSMPEPICHPKAYHVGFANLDSKGKLVIYSRFSFPDHYRSIIAWAIGIDEEQLELVHGDESVRVPQGFSPIMEAILGLAVLSTGRPVFLKCSNGVGEKNGSVTAQWSVR